MNRYKKQYNLVVLSLITLLLSACMPLTVEVTVNGLEVNASYTELPNFELDYSKSYNQAAEKEQQAEFVSKVKTQMLMTLNGSDVTSAFQIGDQQSVIINKSLLESKLLNGPNVFTVSLTADSSNIAETLLNTKSIVPFFYEEIKDDTPVMAFSSVSPQGGMIQIDGFITNPALINEFTINGHNVLVEDDGAFTALIQNSSTFAIKYSDQKGQVIDKVYDRNIQHQVTIRSRIQDTLISQPGIRSFIQQNIKGTVTLPQDILNQLNSLLAIGFLGVGVTADLHNPISLGFVDMHHISWEEGGGGGRIRLGLNLRNLEVNIGATLYAIFVGIGIPMRVFIDNVNADVVASFSVSGNGALSVNLDQIQPSNLHGVRVIAGGFIPIGFDFFTGSLLNIVTSFNFLTEMIIGAVRPNIKRTIDYVLRDVLLDLSLTSPVANLDTTVVSVNTTGRQLYADLKARVTPGANIKQSLGVVRQQTGLDRPGGHTDFGVNLSANLINQVLNAIHVSGLTDQTIYINDPFKQIGIISQEQADVGDWRVQLETTLPMEVLMQQQNRANLVIPGLIMRVETLNQNNTWAPVLSYLLSIAGAADVSLSSSGMLGIDLVEEEISFNVVDIKLLGANIPLVNQITQGVIQVIRPVLLGVFADLGSVNIQLPFDQLPLPLDINNLQYQTSNGQITVGLNLRLK